MRGAPDSVPRRAFRTRLDLPSTLRTASHRLRLLHTELPPATHGQHTEGHLGEPDTGPEKSERARLRVREL